MEELTTDILVIGSGLAGILSAFEAERQGAGVLILGKFAIGMGTNSSLAGGGFLAANSVYSAEDHLRTTLEAGRGLNQPGLVKTLAENGSRAIEALKGYDVPMVERKTGYRIGRPENSPQLSGVLLMKILAERLRGSRVTLLPGFSVFDLVLEEGAVRGASGSTGTGDPV